MSSIRNVIVGTAGHIDHGKSSIVRALTGVDPDRLAEERERGMTIDLGFAPYTHGSGATVGIIDVPGHERFIKNMVAGSTSVDIVVLVVAADDGVMPQTREHLAILDLLGVQRGLVVVNKIDLVEDDLREMAIEDIADFVAGTFLEQAPRIAVSATNGEGIDALRETLDEMIAEIEPRSDDGPFRLPVQRVFSMAGHGLVVTGVPVSGRVAVGDGLEIVASRQPVRVRGIQAYGQACEVGRAGHSTAINLAGTSRDQVARGDVVATPGVFRASRFVAISYRHVDASQALRHRHPVRLHVGTAEALGRVVILDVDSVEPGIEATVQVRLDEPVTTAPGDRVLLRDAASMELLGGGSVLELTDGRLKRFKERVLDDLSARRTGLGDPVALALAELSSAGTRGRSLDDLVVATGCPASRLTELLGETLQDGRIVAAPGGQHFSKEAVSDAADALLAALKAEHKRLPLMEWVDLGAVRARVDLSEALLRIVLERDDRIESASGGRLRRRGHTVNLSSQQRSARENVLTRLSEGDTAPPGVDTTMTGLSEKETRALLDMMRASGEVVAVSGTLFHRDAMMKMRETVIRHGRERDGDIHIPTLRDELGTTRKFLLPLLEHFDAEGLTARHGDRRVLRHRDGDDS